MKDAQIQKAYEAAKERYAEIGVNTDAVLEQIAKVSLSLHCWQTDDVTGFENPDGQLSGGIRGGELTGGIQTTGNYPGKARNIEEVRKDIEKVKTLLPGNHRLNIHAIYGDFGGQKVDRDQIEPKHFQSWIDWAKANNMKLDFNSTSFSHPKSGDQTLSNRDKGIRDFWIEHTIRSRKIADEMGKQLGDKACHNLWIHDGSKDLTVDRYLYRSLLKDSLDKIFASKCPNVKDAVECKLFGTGLESFSVGSHEFYMGYAVKNGIMATLDMGHFHPTELISSKISTVLCFAEKMLLHVSRPVRWDSDHVVLLDDETRQIMREVVRADALERVYIALDYFDASINRVIAWTVGARNARKALLAALLEPVATLKKLEAEGDRSSRLALQQELLTMPMGAVWDEFCERQDVPVGTKWLEDAKKYEHEIIIKR